MTTTLSYNEIDRIQSQAMYDSGLNHLGERCVHMVRDITMAVIWPHVRGDYDDMSKHARMWGPAAALLGPLRHLAQLPIEMGLAEGVAAALGIDAEVAGKSEDLPLIGMAMRPIILAMLQDPPDAANLDVFIERIADVCHRAKSRKAAVGGPHPEDFLTVLTSCVDLVRLLHEDEEDCSDIDDYVAKVFAALDPDTLGDPSAGEDLTTLLADIARIGVDMLTWTPSGGYSDAYAQRMVDSTWITSTSLAEARLMLNDQAPREAAIARYHEEHPEDKHSSDIPDSWWPAAASEGNLVRMRMMDSSHHYCLEDHKESGRTSRGTQRALLDRLSAPKGDKAMRAAIRHLRRERQL